jgi:hypothetical protein
MNLKCKGRNMNAGIVCKWIKKKKIYISHLKETLTPKCLQVWLYEFLLCSKLSESYDGWDLLVGFLMLLHRYL